MSREQSVDKLIPQVFDELRSNMDSHQYPHQSTIASPITTQSLINELENLEKITQVIEQITSSVKHNIPKDIDRIYEVCQSSNKLLDSWIGIQSQAGYIYRLMGEPSYLRHLREDGIEHSFEEEVKLETESIEQLKKEIVRVNAIQSGESKSQPQQQQQASKTTIRKPNRSIYNTNSNSKKPTGIRRPTITKERKLFRR
ncbi:similar to Saccharomyces cerevisiae YGL061C DUO1 Essential subunit of the Dam1 complex (aka DASH complex) [Maudiozyma barnettii]|uniref:DASH complex subunit DUO1 n=1 Tax=Maudiozyma barnettii TaxID=61262 RepID=A0A8H2VI91_9SACH|nr:Duo1p [Kazachstania barnettii]CAB4255838.1 similar to Saccharomyces cerevisiae YGL061C DUO1 Essential subunit of the Dam1 complex (aka DASH complex) [Kazachstania barnettii]CAD1784399.1 similar to Saccharomyces cerevisiae YGL061C DUO1 Essential subunit of the Dam1 complex (aka DASH complex) [Kazachstania barnettii]